MNVRIDAVQLSFPEDANIIVGQSHFIKTVEDLSEILVGAVPGIAYGIAFCEASGPSLIRKAGNSEELVKVAVTAAEEVAAGHTFYIVLKEAFPINVLNQIKQCPEVVSIFAATANALQIVVAQTDQGRGIIGVVDGNSPAGVETEDDQRDRHALLRTIGYKF